MIRILQANLHRSKTANDLLYQLVTEKQSDLLLISEQYTEKESPLWFSDTLGTSAIWVLDPGKVLIKDHGSSDGYVWVETRGVTYFSVYLTPNESRTSAAK